MGPKLTIFYLLTACALIGCTLVPGTADQVSPTNGTLENPAGAALQKPALSTALIRPSDPKNMPPKYTTDVMPKPGEPVLPATPAINPELAMLVDSARQDLADRLGIHIKQVSLVSAESVTWPDAALGCPQPGLFYAQVLSPGYRILVEAVGSLYSYHTDLVETIILCEQDQEFQVTAPD